MHKSLRKNPDLSICIVNYNTRTLLENNLRFIGKNSRNINLEIIVVDNNSLDGSSEMVKKQFPQVKIIQNRQNLFFTKAYNQALKISRGKYILILNSDILIPPGALDKMIIFMEKYPECAASSCRQVDIKKRLDYTCSRFPTPIIELLESSLLGKIFSASKLLKNYRYKDWQRNTIRFVDVIPGSFMLLRHSMMDIIGGFDEGFRLFYCENDLCLRIKKAGYSILFNPAVTIIHHRAESLKKIAQDMLITISLNDMLFYYQKYFGSFWRTFLWLNFHLSWFFWRLRLYQKNQQ